jgi:hypothetical protein
MKTLKERTIDEMKAMKFCSDMKILGECITAMKSRLSIDRGITFEEFDNIVLEVYGDTPQIRKIISWNPKIVSKFQRKIYAGRASNQSNTKADLIRGL